MDPLDSDQFKSILSDNQSGSVDLLLQLNQWLKSNINKIANHDLLVSKIKSSLAHFQTIKVYTDNLEKLLEFENSEGIFTFFEQTEIELHSAHYKIFENGLAYFSDVKRIITLSNSFTVAQFIINLNNNGDLDEVLVSESRPVMEGRLSAEKFIEHGIVVRFITDASVSHYLGGIDAAIIGADKILKDGSVINKTGSLQLAILCKHFKVPFYVIADKSKFSSTNRFEQEEMPGNEIWNFQHTNLKIENLYFEKIESELITQIISD